MPTIPKFAVDLAKLAKSKPKIIPSSSTQITNKRKRETHDKITNQHTKRIKSDTKPLEKEKIIKPINQNLSKKSKDNSKLLSVINSLKRKKTKGINEIEALNYIKEYQIFLDLFETESEIHLLSKLKSILDKVQTSKKFNINEINSLIQEILKQYKGVIV
ncbi:MAG: hypothetical protein IJI84_04220 [Clostridia bacterium]|nr:hypothetical protein [Clostridia bacterium]